METKRRMRTMGRRAALVLGLLGGVAAAVAVATARVEAPVAASLAKPTAHLTADPTRRSDSVPEALSVRACAPGKAVVRERAVVGTGNGRLCITVGRDLTGSTHVDPLYSEISSKVIGYFQERAGDTGSTASTVVCWSKKDWLANGGAGLLGFVWPGSGVVNLAPEVCAELDELVYDGARDSEYKTAEAVDTLAHESIHVAGVLNEARTECYAIQLTQYTGEQLGTTSEFGFQLGTILLDQYDSWKGTEYYTPACHDGSKLDLYPDTTVFP